MSSRTVYTLLEETAAAHGDQPALHQPMGRGEYQKWTWRELRDVVQWTAVGLSTIGAVKGSMIALQSETRAEFYFADLGVMAAGAVAAAVVHKRSLCRSGQRDPVLRMQNRPGRKRESVSRPANRSGGRRARDPLDSAYGRRRGSRRSPGAQSMGFATDHDASPNCGKRDAASWPRIRPRSSDCKRNTATPISRFST